MPPTPTISDAPSGNALRLWRLVIVVAVFAIFARAATGQFVNWDDSFNLYENPNLNPPTLRGVAWYWTHAAYGLYIPLTCTVWGILAALAHGPPDDYGVSLNPWVFHSANVVLHAGSALVAFEVLRRLISRDAAGIAALLFGLHPVQVESVAWAAGLKDVLAGLLALTALWQYVEFARADQGTSAPRARVHYLFASTWFLLAMLAKPSAMVLPAIAFSIDCWLLHRPVRRALLSVAPWIVLSLPCAIIARRVQDTVAVDAAPLWARPLIAGDALAFYLYKLVWPIDLSFDYGRLPSAVMGKWWFYLTWLAPAGIAIVLWVKRRSWPHLFVGGLVFFLALSPVLGLTTFQFQHVSTVADHYLYLPMLGVALAAGWLFEHVSARLGRRQLLSLSAVVLGALGVRSLIQVGVWRDDFSLFSHAVEVNPSSSVAHNNLANVYNRQNQLTEAQRLFRRTIELDPDNWMARANLASILEGQGEHEEAIDQQRAALQIMRRQQRGVEGAIPEVAYNLARQLAGSGRYEEALVHLALALEYRPNDPTILAAVEEVRSRQATTSPSDVP